MGSDTIKELRTPSVKYREFLALNSEEDVEVYLFEDEVISGSGFAIANITGSFAISTSRT